MHVVHHNVLPSIRVHLALVDPGRDCDLYDGGVDGVDGVVDDGGDDDVHGVDDVDIVDRTHLTFSKIIKLSAQR